MGLKVRLNHNDFIYHVSQSGILTLEANHKYPLLALADGTFVVKDIKDFDGVLLDKRRFFLVDSTQDYLRQEGVSPIASVIATPIGTIGDIGNPLFVKRGRRFSAAGEKKGEWLEMGITNPAITWGGSVFSADDF